MMQQPVSDGTLLILWRALVTAIPGAMLFILWKIGKAAVEMRDSVRDIMTNHLPHIYGELKAIKKELKHEPEE